MVNTWIGAESNSYTEPSNWTRAYVNNGSLYIKDSIPNYPLIDGKYSVYNVEIEPGANLTIGNDGDVTVSNNFILYSSETKCFFY